MWGGRFTQRSSLAPEPYAFAKQQDQTARTTGDAVQCRVARRALQHARKIKAHALKSWERDWLSMKADEANAALSTPNVTDTFRIVKHICTAVEVKTRDGGSKTCHKCPRG